MATYYISSTKEDLEPEREVVLQAVKDLRHQAVSMESYTAQGVRPLEKCLRDVSECERYILILGFRYGTIPPGGDLSFTHEEFRRALREKKENVHCFLKESTSTDLSDTDRTTINEFRKEVGDEVMTMPFSTEEELKQAVKKTIHRDPGPGNPIPEGIIASVDRSVQRLDIKSALAQVSTGESPQLIVLHGRTEQNHSNLVEHVKDQLGPDVLQTPRPIPYCFIGFSNGARLGELLRERLCDEAGRTDAAAGLASLYPDGVVIRIQLDATTWQNCADPLRVIADFFRQWRRSTHPVVVFVEVHYVPPASEASFRDRRRHDKRQQAIEASIDALRSMDDRVNVLDRLGDVGLAEATEWLEQERALKHEARTSLIERLRGFYDRLPTETVPMDLLAKELREMMDNDMVAP